MDSLESSCVYCAGFYGGTRLNIIGTSATELVKTSTRLQMTCRHCACVAENSKPVSSTLAFEKNLSVQNITKNTAAERKFTRCHTPMPSLHHWTDGIKQLDIPPA
jgi:hypothetical protein